MSEESDDSDYYNQRVSQPAIDVLEELRQFCADYFVSFNDNQKMELKQKLYSCLVKVIPQLCSQLNRQILDFEPNIVHVRSLCYVFGDIHGNVLDLYDYETKFWSSTERKANYMFLGDYVDRGKFGIEVCAYLFALKLLYPQQFTLIRGNHEFRDVQIEYTFYDECKEKFGRYLGKAIWENINTCFDRLPLVAIIDNQIFCCHGGVPKDSEGTVTLNNIEQIPKPLVKSKDSPIAENILWNDPIESMTTYNTYSEDSLKNVEFIYNRTRGVGQYYTSEAVKKFLELNNLEFIFRAHESVKEGFKFTSNDRVITIFSSSNYNGMKNTTACIRVDYQFIEIVIIKKPVTSKQLTKQWTTHKVM